MTTDYIEECRAVVKECQYREYGKGKDKFILDMQTANAIVAVYDAINEKNKARMAAMPLPTMARIAWKAIANSRSN